ncbi:MAG: retroviral-like aspartic protease family protein [Steroidobacteraceae bacterium]
MPVSWSRRSVLIEGALALAFALGLPRAIGRERSGETPPRLAPVRGRSPASPPAEGSGALSAITALGGRLTTAVRIDGQGPFRFMVDTGAEKTVIADDLVERLALPQGREVLVEGIVRGKRARLAEIRELSMGSLVCRGLQVATLPRAMLHVDGYLGLDVLDGRRVIFDFVTGTITISKPRGFFAALWADWTRTDEVRVPTLGNSGRLRAADCLIDRVHAAAFLDTGAEVSIINHKLYAALERRNGAQTEQVTEILTGVTGGSVVGTTTVLDMIVLGQLVLTFTPAVVADLPVFKLFGLNQKPALLIGMDCLRRCARVSIDYGRKELRFELASAQMPQPLQAELSPPLAG